MHKRPLMLYVCVMLIFCYVEMHVMQFHILSVVHKFQEHDLHLLFLHSVKSVYYHIDISC